MSSDATPIEPPAPAPGATAPGTTAPGTPAPDATASGTTVPTILVVEDDPEVRTFDSGNKIATTRIAVTERFIDRNNQQQERTEWISIVFNGKLAVEWCYIHDGTNSDKGGGIMATESEGDELVLANSIIAYNKADAHAGGVSVSGAGTKVTVVNCLFYGNASIAQYGYTAAIHGQSGVKAYLCNNTFVENVNWRDGSSATSSPWSAIMFRNGGTHIEMVNCISAGNKYFLPGVADRPDEHPDRYDMPIKPEFILELQAQQVDLNVVAGDDPDWVYQSNLFGGVDADIGGILRAGISRDPVCGAKVLRFQRIYRDIFKRRNPDHVEPVVQIDLSGVLIRLRFREGHPDDADQVDAFDAIAFGCPSMGSEEPEDSEFEPMFSNVKGRLAGRKIALFGSYGWGDGEWMRSWEEDCKAIPHKDSAADALSDFSSDCTEIPKAY